MVAGELQEVLELAAKAPQGVAVGAVVVEMVTKVVVEKAGVAE